MPKLGGYVCEGCGSKAESKKYLDLYHRDCRATTGRGQDSDPDPQGQTTGSETTLTQDNPTKVNDKVGSDAAGSDGSDRSTPISISEIQGVRAGQDSDPDPLTEIRNAVGYLNARRDYLNRWELGFVSSVAFILGSKTNGDRARSITPDMVCKLFETHAKVEALEERDKRQDEYDRVQRHFTDMKQPGHTWCDLCTKDKRERDEAKATWESAMAEQDAVIEETRLRKERERLEASRMNDRPRPAVKPWVLAQKKLAARKAAVPGAKNEGAADAR